MWDWQSKGDLYLSKGNALVLVREQMDTSNGAVAPDNNQVITQPPKVFTPNKHLWINIIGQVALLISFGVLLLNSSITTLEFTLFIVAELLIFSLCCIVVFWNAVTRFSKRLIMILGGIEILAGLYPIVSFGLPALTYKGQGWSPVYSILILFTALVVAVPLWVLGSYLIWISYRIKVNQDSGVNETLPVKQGHNLLHIILIILVLIPSCYLTFRLADKLFNGSKNISAENTQTKTEMQSYLNNKYGKEFICIKEPKNGGYYGDLGGSNGKTYITEATFKISDNSSGEFDVVKEQNSKESKYYDGYIVLLTEEAIDSELAPTVYNRLGETKPIVSIDLGNRKIAKQYSETAVNFEKFSQIEGGGRATLQLYVNNGNSVSSAESQKIELLLEDLKSLEKKYPYTLRMIDTLGISYMNTSEYNQINSTLTEAARENIPSTKYVYFSVGIRNPVIPTTAEIIEKFNIK